MVRIAMSLVVLAGMAVCPMAAGGEEPQLSEEALKAIQADDWPAVLRLLGPAAKGPDGPVRAVASHWVGVAYFQTGDLGRAAEHLRQAMHADPSCRATAELLARCAERGPTGMRSTLPDYAEELQRMWGFDGDVVHSIGRGWMQHYLTHVKSALDMYAREANRSLPRAVECFRRAEDLGTTQVDNARWLAFLLYRDGQYEEAGGHAWSAIRRGPGTYDSYLILGGAMMALGRPAAAERAYQEALRRAPGKSALIEHERGKALYQAGNYGEAVEAFRKALAKSWDQFNVRHWIGLSALAARDYRLAMWGFIESRNVDERVDDLYYKGRCAYAIKRYDLAEEYCAKAIETYKAKMLTATRQEKPGPTEWVHYLGRAQWAQGKHDEAMKNLEDAFDRWRSNGLYARWLYRAYLARDDLHGAIDVCRRLGESAELRPDAIRGILNILERWPQPRITDMLARKPKPHTYLAWDVLGDLYEQDRRFHTAACYYELARRTRGPASRTLAGWTLFHIRQYEQAEQTFRDCLRAYRDESKDYARWGLGTVLLFTRRWAEADQSFAEIKRQNMLLGSAVGRLFAAIGGGDARARELADPYTLLGLMDNRLLGADRGVSILCVIPGGALAGCDPRLAPDDVLLRVGDQPLGSAEQIAAFRKTPVPTSPVQALVARGKLRFHVTLDYPALMRRLPEAPATQPAAWEAIP